MRSSRLLAQLVHLQATGRATAAELAELAEVSVRTIYRDVAALQAAGVPLWTEPGPRGGIRLVEGWQAEVGGLTADEVGVLALAGIPGAAADLGLGPTLAAAEAKLAAGLRPELRSRTSAVRSRFLLDAPRWHQPPDEVPFLRAVAGAVWADRRIDVRYRAGRSGREVERRLDPLGLVLKGGAWYVVAAHRGEARTYRVSRMATVRLRDEAVRRPPGFALGPWWRSSAAAFEDAILTLDVALRVSPAGLGSLADVVPGGPSRAAVAAAREAGPDPDGWYAVALRVESEWVAVHQLVGLGSAVEVVAPRSLRRSLAAEARALADRNA